MNRLIATVAFGALALSGCIKGNDSYKEVLAVRPGMVIYSYTTTQNAVAMQGADAGLRVAVLAAEAARQQISSTQGVDLSAVTHNGKKVLAALFGEAATVELEDGNYRITYDKSSKQPGGFYLGGTLLVETGGAELLSDTEPSKPWTIDMQGLELYSYNSYGQQQQIEFTGGTTELCCDDGGTYLITLRSIRAGFKGQSVVSDWSGSFRLKVSEAYNQAADASLAYSLCTGKDFSFDGAASGGSIYESISKSALGLSYRLSEGIYRGLQIIGGSERCAFTSPLDYNASDYPAPDVLYTWSYDRNSNYLYQQISYNGYVYPRN